MYFTEAQITQFAEHAKLIGLFSRGVESFNYTPDERHCLAFIMNEAPATTFCYCFNIRTTDTTIQVQYFVGDKQYSSKMTLEQFLSLNEEDVEWLMYEAQRVNKKYNALSAQLKSIPKTHKGEVEQFLKSR